MVNDEEENGAKDAVLVIRQNEKFLKVYKHNSNNNKNNKKKEKDTPQTIKRYQEKRTW